MEESRQILSTMKDDLAGNILQNIITVVLAADENGDNLLSDTEIDVVVRNIEGLQGVDLPNEKLKQLIIGKGRCVAGE